MPKTVFISYSHHQGEWVWQRLKPCLQAGGAEVRIAVERVCAGVWWLPMVPGNKLRACR